MKTAAQREADLKRREIEEAARQAAAIASGQDRTAEVTTPSAPGPEEATGEEENAEWIECRYNKSTGQTEMAKVDPTDTSGLCIPAYYNRITNVVVWDKPPPPVSPPPPPPRRRSAQ